MSSILLVCSFWLEYMKYAKPAAPAPAAIIINRPTLDFGGGGGDPAVLLELDSAAHRLGAEDFTRSSDPVGIRHDPHGDRPYLYACTDYRLIQS